VQQSFHPPERRLALGIDRDSVGCAALLLAAHAATNVQNRVCKKNVCTPYILEINREGERVMIRFYCEHCAHKISVLDKDTGKHGRCPKCGKVIVVPSESTVIEFYCEKCGRKISAPRGHAGKKAICPKCKSTFMIPTNQFTGSAEMRNSSGDLIAHTIDSRHDLTLIDVPEEYKLKDGPVEQYQVSEQTNAGQYESEEDLLAEETEPAGQRSLPWFIDIFLYPFNLAGVIYLISLWLLLFLLCPLVIALLGLGIEFIPVVYLLPVAYSLYYFTECIRDSALGRRRAVDLRHSPAKPDRWDYISQLFVVVGSIAVCFSPVAVYYIITERSDLIYWLTLACGGFFFPMVLLAVVLFDSFGALNPILIIGSIFRTLLPYCGMVLFFFAGALLFMKIDSPVNRFWLLPAVPFLIKIVQLYMIIVAVGLLGRFYHQYEKRLGWEV
jgi:hypothetical protein